MPKYMDLIKTLNLSIGIEQLTDPDDKDKFEELTKAVADLFREWSVKDCFSMFVVPGYLGSVENIDTVARQLGLPNKVHVMTDLPNFEKFEEVMDMLEDPAYANLPGIDNYKQYVSVFANYIMARESNQYEDGDMWIPPSAAVAGKMYQGDTTVGMQQPSFWMRIATFMMNKMGWKLSNTVNFMTRSRRAFTILRTCWYLRFR